MHHADCKQGWRQRKNKEDGCKDNAPNCCYADICRQGPDGYCCDCPLYRLSAGRRGQNAERAFGRPGVTEVTIRNRYSELKKYLQDFAKSSSLAMAIFVFAFQSPIIIHSAARYATTVLLR